MSQMKYHATAYFAPQIDAVEVIRETAKYVVVPGTSWHKNTERREQKESNRSRWFDTWGEAHEWLMKIAENKVERARSSLESAQSKLLQVKGMREEA